MRHGIAMSDHLKDIIIRLLDRDPSTRLGAGKDDALEVVQHPFFSGMDWNALQNCKLDSPYKPEIRKEHESQNMDDIEN